MKKMKYITKNTYRKIHSTFSIYEVDNGMIYEDIKINSTFIEILKDTFNDFENIRISCFHQPKNKFEYNKKESATYHSKSDCEILLSDYKKITFPKKIIEHLIDTAKKENKNDEEIKSIINTENKKYENLVKKHFSNLENINFQNNDFINEVIAIWGIKSDINLAFANNSGIIEIENTNLKELSLEINHIINNLKDSIGIEITFENILLILFNTFINDNKFGYRKENLNKFENEILNILVLNSVEKTLEMQKNIRLYFKIYLNEMLKFEDHLFFQLDLNSCNANCLSDLLINLRNMLNIEIEK